MSNILDKIASASSEVKENLENESKIVTTPNTKMGRKVEDEVLYFEITESDNEFTAYTKDLINKSNVTRKELYNILPRGEAYNMIYTLRNGSLSILRMKKWINDVLNKDIIITTVDRNEDE